MKKILKVKTGPAQMKEVIQKNLMILCVPLVVIKVYLNLL